jgi:hypothetical protein
LEESGSASSGSEEEQSPSPPRRSHRSKGAREKAIVKVKTEDPEQRRMMKSIEDTLEAIKVNLAENRKPRRTIPTSRINVWCSRCRDPGHYASECQRPTPKRIHYVNPEEEVFYAQPEEEVEETSAIYQVQPTYGRGKVPQLPIRSSVMANRNYQVGPSQGTNFNNPVRFSNYGDRQLGCCFICGDPNHYANNCPHRGPGQGAPLKVKMEDPESRRMMKSIEETLEAIKVNLEENRKPRRTIPTSQMNVWCASCGDLGHYASKCQRPTPKRIHYVNPEEEVFYAQPEEEAEETSAIYQVQPTYGRGKAPQLPI